MTTLDLESILHSPRLPDIAAVLNERLRDETERRERFYDEMSDDQKVEFIGGEIVMHSPARNRHLTAQLALALLLVAAAGGAFINLNFHWKMLPLPKGLILVHAGLAVCGFLLLVIATWKASHA